ncbi:MAG: hypothetical protein R3338_00560 [Thermoanaerobaculia bacterium]|nr:hypothetical protein [Thermoanaerobaculia bacterium]
MIFWLLLFTQFPSGSDTAWMEPAAFHLALGDAREEIENAFEARGWKLIEAEDDDEVLVHDYANGKSLTMEFRQDRLVSARFELVSFGAQLSRNWEDVTARLRERHGNPLVEESSIFITEADEMSVHAVLDDRPDSALGKQGAGRIIVRYFVPGDVFGSFETRR